MHWKRLGIIAGAGPLPLALAASPRAAGESGASPFIVRIAGIADGDFSALEACDCGIGEVGGVIRHLKTAGCDAVVLAGLVTRPDFSALKLDLRGAALLPKVVAAAARGDGALLESLVETLEGEGFRVVGAHEIAQGLQARAGALGGIAPDTEHFADMAKAAAVIAALGPFDIGQGAVVAQGLVLAVEAAEGTDAMLARCAGLPASIRGSAKARAGVLVKRPKPGQELRVDLPTIGPETVAGAARAGLAGIAYAADEALLMEPECTARAADDAGLFVYGYTPDELP